MMAIMKAVLVSSAILLSISLTFVSSETSHQTVLMRSPRSIGNFIRRWFGGRRKPTGFQGTAQANQPYSFGSYSQASSSYPSYAYPLYPNLPYSPNYFQNGYQGYSGYPMGSASSQYPSYTPPATFTPQSYGSSPGTMDFHQVLDQFVRSAGLSPQGDHEGHALQSKGDSFTQSGTTPVFSFKKLYSFPFYMSTDPNVAEGYNFLKRYTRRNSPEAQLNQQSLDQNFLLKQFLSPPVVKGDPTSSQSQPQNIQQENQLKGSQPQDYLQAEDIEQRL